MDPTAEGVRSGNWRSEETENQIVDDVSCNEDSSHVKMKEKFGKIFLMSSCML